MLHVIFFFFRGLFFHSFLKNMLLITPHIPTFLPLTLSPRSGKKSKWKLKIGLHLSLSPTLTYTDYTCRYKNYACLDCKNQKKKINLCNSRVDVETKVPLCYDIFLRPLIQNNWMVSPYYGEDLHDFAKCYWTIL